MKLTYNPSTKQHGFKDKSICPYCSKEFKLETMDKDLFNKTPCFECFMKGETNAP